MAQQNKAQDAVAAAMSAIEEALNMSVADQAKEGKPAEPGDEAKSQAAKPLPNIAAAPAPTVASAAPDRRAAAEPRAMPAPIRPPKAEAPKADAPSLAPPPLPSAGGEPPAAPSPPLPTTPPANDDRPSVGQLLLAFQSRPPSRAPLIAAIAASVLWLLFCGAFLAQRGDLFGGRSALSREFWLQPQVALAALVVVGPVLFIFAIAALVRRSQELRGAARAISQVAMRLAEPETVASEQVATLSQAIRREVASMGDGIERALARASELETLVRGEVSNLERSYSDNERRVRALIAELADQREAIVANGGKVRAAIAGAHQGVAADLDAVADRLNERILTAGQGLVASLGATAEGVGVALERAGADTIEKIGGHSAHLTQTLAAVGADVAHRLAEATDRNAASLIERVADIDQRVKSTGEALTADLTMRGEDLVSRLDAAGARVSDAMIGHGESLVARVAQTSEAMLADFTARADDVAARLDNTGGRIAETILDRG
ncbi:MAG TPA: hypothetical protein VKV96_06660, partial [Roseiarcus sp.]|nr:hypothetical protein [Roseiarcus sp.]